MKFNVTIKHENVLHPKLESIYLSLRVEDFIIVHLKLLDFDVRINSIREQQLFERVVFVSN